MQSQTQSRTGQPTIQGNVAQQVLTAVTECVDRIEWVKEIEELPDTLHQEAYKVLSELNSFRRKVNREFNLGMQGGQGGGRYSPTGFSTPNSR